MGDGVGGDLPAEADDERQMVAEAALVAGPDIGAPRPSPAMAAVGLQQEGSGEDGGLFDGADQRCADQYVVDALPAPLIAVCTAHINGRIARRRTEGV